MSLRSSVRALPTLLKVGFAEAVAYRAEMLVWILSTTMPLVMLALWTAVARGGPVVAESGRAFGQGEFVSYFLATFIVRQLVSAWASWQINFEVRTGTLSMRLLRPLNPLLAYAVENVAAIPMRLVIALPMAGVALWVVGGGVLPRDPLMWGIFTASMVGAWLIGFLVQVTIGCLSLYIQSSIKVMDVWLALYFVFSGYLFPLELFPEGLRRASNFLPFRYQIGLPVELLSSMHDRSSALALLGGQWAFVALSALLAAVVWRGGLKRFAAFGG